jgi:hypothetical protein
MWQSTRSMQRVLRWDGIVTQTDDVDEIRAIADHVERERPANLRAEDHPFEIVVQGSTPAKDSTHAARIVRPYVEAGATWWIDADWRAPTVDSVRRRIAAGPPRA